MHEDVCEALEERISLVQLLPLKGEEKCCLCFGEERKTYTKRR